MDEHGMQAWGGCSSPVKLDTRKKDTSLGETRNVKYNMGDLNWEKIGEVWFDYEIGSSPQQGSCWQKRVDVRESGDQITSLKLPNGNVYTEKLDENKDQVILVVFEIKGTSEDNKCIFKRVASVKNR